MRWQPGWYACCATNITALVPKELPAEAIKQEFLEHANEEQHAEKIASVLADVGQWQNNR